MGEVVGVICAAYATGAVCMIPVIWEHGDNASEKFAIVAAWPLFLAMTVVKGLVGLWQK